MQNAHIINIGHSPLQQYIARGFLGVGIVLDGSTSGKLSRACRTSFSMYADMQSVRAGDIIFVHEGDLIYGGFEATSAFVEDNNVNPMILSANMLYRDQNGHGLSQLLGGALPQIVPSDFRQIAIRDLQQGGRSNCFQNGVLSTKLFDLKARGRIWTIPERWKYADSARTIRPLMLDEAQVLIELLELENRGQTIPAITPMIMGQGHLPITPILDPNRVVDEKIVEGWILSNIGRNQHLDTICGEFTSIGNNVPIGYLKFMDIYGYFDLPSGARLHKVLEVKRDQAVFPANVMQLVKYMHDLKALSDPKRESVVEGFLFCRSFSQDAIDFVRNRNLMDSRISLVEYDYVQPNYQTLTLNQIV